MSSENKQLIQRMYDAFNRGDIDTVLAGVTGGVAWHALGAAPFDGRYLGRDQVRQFFKVLGESVQMDQFDVDEILADGNKVVALGKLRATVRESGHHYETPWVHIFELREGKVASLHIFSDTHAVASAFGESTRERRALTGPLGVTEPPYSGGETSD